MKYTHRTQFNICDDNAAAAKELAGVLRAAGYQAEVDTANPAAVDHDAPADVHTEAIGTIEEKRAKKRPSRLGDDRISERLAGDRGTSPTGPFGGRGRSEDQNEPDRGGSADQNKPDRNT